MEKTMAIYKNKSWYIYLNKILENTVSVCMIIMVLLVFLNAFLRYVFNDSITQSEELSRYCFIWASFLGAIMALRDNQHVGVSIITNLLKGRVKLFVEILGDLLIITANVVILLGGQSFIGTLTNSKGASTGIPFAYIAFSIVVCAVSMGTITIFRLFQKVKDFAEYGRRN